MTFRELDCAQRAQTSAKASNLNQIKVIRNSNPDCRINPDSDPDVRRIVSKTLWIHYLVGVSHFAECRENRPVMRNANKSLRILYFAMVREVEK